MANHFNRALLIFSTVVFSWLAMMVVHEFGHVLNAWISGGQVVKVVLHPLAISRTDVVPNPHPAFERWGGAVWGCVIPVLACQIAKLRKSASLHVFAFFAGFCLIANGAYLSASVLSPVGDGKNLIDMGVNRAWLVAWGAITIPIGFWFWNGLGPAFGIGAGAKPADRTLACRLLLVTVILIVVEFLLSDRI